MSDMNGCVVVTTNGRQRIWTDDEAAAYGTFRERQEAYKAAYLAELFTRSAYNGREFRDTVDRSYPVQAIELGYREVFGLSAEENFPELAIAGRFAGRNQ